MGAAASSSSSCALAQKKYDVFISFRGEDTRTNFTSHLHTALCQKGIETYIDYRLQKGDEISHSLIQAIEDSSISVVVFSQNYASSKWCLDELVQILQCRKYLGQVVIPVFYKVDPSDVRKQNGSYKDAFTNHETDFIHDQHKVNKWKDALFETANLAGWDSQPCRDESEFIQNIVNDVLEKLNLQCPIALECGLVGIGENCKCIELLLEKAPIVGIWGMGGIGKTTMAKTVFAKLYSQFESYCFLENLREESEKHGLPNMCNKLLLELLKGENLYHSMLKDVGSTFDMRRLKSKKVLIVLDDVNSSEQLEFLARKGNCLGPNSRVIITTRDKHLLNIIEGAIEIYEAKTLDYEASLELFSLKAFHKHHLEIGYEKLSKRAIDYAQGIPLALVVLGSFLHSKTTEEWESALEKLKKTPNKLIQEVLKLSYDGLDDEEKEMFLDIACFLKGEAKEHVMTLLASFDFHSSIGLRTLVDKALITIDNSVWMHDLIQQMGWEIVRQECIKEPGRRSRLWDLKEVYDVLENNEGTKAVECIILNLSQISDIHLNANTFKKMTSLRFLKFYFLKYERSYKVNLPSGLESFSNKLRYFHWDCYPLESLPSTFHPENLVVFHMENSQVKKLWDADKPQNFVNLRRINLSGSKQLMELPDFSKARNLEEVKLWDCESLRNVHPSILSLPKLYALELVNCTKLESIQSESHSKSLRHLGVSFCYNLKEFSLSSEEIIQLHLENTGIEMLHSSIGRFSKLKLLFLSGLTLKNLPIKELSCLRSLEALSVDDCGQLIDEPILHILFDGLHSLRYLHLAKCSNLSTLPHNISNLLSLDELIIKESNIKSLPASINHLSNLRRIELSNCSNLFALPDNISNLLSLRSLRLEGSSIKCLPDSIKHLSNLEIMDLSNCSDLSTLPESIGNLISLYNLVLQGSSIESLPYSIKHVSNLERINLSNCKRIRCLPEIPSSIRYLNAKSCVSLAETEVSLTTCILQKDNEENKMRKYSLLFPNCMKLDESSVFEEFAEFSVKGAVYNKYGTVNVCYPGSKVPEWFRYRQTTLTEASVTIELAPPLEDLKGFLFCSVLSQLISKEESRSFLECQCQELEVDENVKLRAQWIDWLTFKELNSDHVFLWYCPFNVKSTTCNCRGEVTFEFYVSAFREHDGYVKHDGLSPLIKACGVYPIYDSEYHNFVQQMELELGRKTKSLRDIDHQQLLPPTKKLKESSIVDSVLPLEFDGPPINKVYSRRPRQKTN